MAAAQRLAVDLLVGLCSRSACARVRAFENARARTCTMARAHARRATWLPPCKLRVFTQSRVYSLEIRGSR